MHLTPNLLLERPEHFFVHALLSVTVLSFYAVIVILLLQKRNFAELSDRFNEEKQWHKIAHVDALTGMKNRMAYMEMLDRLERISRSKDQLYAIMIDINNFKKINDTYGHYAGDAALKKAAEFLNEVFNGNDFMIFRVGGDEFAIISLNAELNLIEEAFLKLRQYDFGYDLNCSFSIGYSMIDLVGDNAFENAFIRADKMMYADKMKIKEKL